MPITACSRITLFRNADPTIIRALSRCLHPAYYLRNEYIVRKDDLADEIFFIGLGAVEVVSEDGLTVFDTMRSGEAFGEVGVMYNVPRVASVRAQVRRFYLWWPISDILRPNPPQLPIAHRLYNHSTIFKTVVESLCSRRGVDSFGRSTGWRKKTGPPSHCKYSEIP